MSDMNGDCARESGLRYNGATLLAHDLLTTFTNRIADLQSSGRATMDAFHTVRASMFTPGITVPTMEAKEMELLDLVERLEDKSKEVETLLQQVDVDAVGRLIRELPSYRELSEADGRGLVLEYCDDVRLQFFWLRPQALAIKRKMAAGTVSEIRTRTRLETQ